MIALLLLAALAMPSVVVALPRWVIELAALGTYVLLVIWITNLRSHVP